MNNPSSDPVVVTPRHVWIVGVLALLWNSVGAFDYLMTESRNQAYMSKFTPEQLAYFYAFPMWVIFTWALSVWAGVLGSVLLLLRKRWAVPVFTISLAALLLTFFYNYVLTNGVAVMGGVGGLLFSAVIFVIAVALLVYARALARKGVLG